MSLIDKIVRVTDFPFADSVDQPLTLELEVAARLRAELRVDSRDVMIAALLHEIDRLRPLPEVELVPCPTCTQPIPIGTQHDCLLDDDLPF